MSDDLGHGALAQAVGAEPCQGEERGGGGATSVGNQGGLLCVAPRLSVLAWAAVARLSPHIPTPSSQVRGGTLRGSGLLCDLPGHCVF